MLVPGASRSVMLLRLVNDEKASAFVVEPTEVAFLMQAGELMLTVLALLPDATTTEIL